ncbi:MAG TPA: hypothetical protein VFD46_03170, partial [Chryseolinea sp.]|nr:hypothetical protein [Chryseolinea sp.]
PKVKAEQQSLFGESPQNEKNEIIDNQLSESFKLPESSTPVERPPKETGKEFGVGETIDLEI